MFASFEIITLFYDLYNFAFAFETLIITDGLCEFIEKFLKPIAMIKKKNSFDELTE